MTTIKDAPTLSLTFDNKYMQGTYTIIDLSWYAPYKEFGDNVICMFFYLSFIWHVFVSLSAAIQGASTQYDTYEIASNVVHTSDMIRGQVKK